MQKAELRPIPSIWGHHAGNPVLNPELSHCKAPGNIGKLFYDVREETELVGSDWISALSYRCCRPVDFCGENIQNSTDVIKIDS